MYTWGTKFYGIFFSKHQVACIWVSLFNLWISAFFLKQTISIFVTDNRNENLSTWTKFKFWKASILARFKFFALYTWSIWEITDFIVANCLISTETYRDNVGNIDRASLYKKDIGLKADLFRCNMLAGTRKWDTSLEYNIIPHFLFVDEQWVLRESQKWKANYSKLNQQSHRWKL